MARREFKTIIDELQEIYEKQGHPVKHAAFQGDHISFGKAYDLEHRFQRATFDLRNNGVHRSYKKSNYETEYDKISSKQDERNENPVAKSSAEAAYDDLKTDKYDVSGKTTAQLELKASSTIQQAAYFPTKQYLVVGFKNGGSYSYDGVGEDIIESWQAADSAGSFFYYNIRMSFKYQKLG